MAGERAGGKDAVTDDGAVTEAVDAAVLEGSYADVTAAPLQAKPPAAAPGVKGELVISAVFDRPKGFTDAQEVGLITQVPSNWSPSTADFDACAATGPRGKAGVLNCNNVGDFLGAIQAEKEGALTRVVVIAHSTSSLLGFGGSIDAAGAVSITTSGGFHNPLAGGVDLNAINGLKEEAFAGLVSDIRKRWAGGSGEILFFSCGTGKGVNVALMQELATVLGAKAKGFSKLIGWCCDHDGKRVTRRGMTTLSFKQVADPADPSRKIDVPDCATAQLGYKHLTPDRP